MVELEFGDVGFRGGRRPENPEKIPWSKAKTNNKVKKAYGTGSEWIPGHIGERRALLPQRHLTELIR